MAVATVVMMVTIVMVVPIPVAVMHIGSVWIITRIGRIVDRRGSRVYGSGRDHYGRRTHRRYGSAHAWDGNDNCGNGDTDIDAERYAGACRIGGTGSEGDCDCTE